MDLRSQVRAIEKEMRKRRLDRQPKALFFDSEEEYQEAKNNILDDDTCIIDDLHEEDLVIIREYLPSANLTF